MNCPLHSALCVMVLCAPWSATKLVTADVIERRGAEPALTGDVQKVDSSGITVKSNLGAEHVISWDRVRHVQQTAADPRIDEHLERAEQLWRARSRVERHDTALAESLLERAFETYRGQTHETALVVAEGLLRCRLARQAHDLAVIPALETARIRRAGIKTNSYSMLPPVIDADTALCPALAPAWAQTSGLLKLEKELAAYQPKDDPVVKALAAAYRRALLARLGTTPEGTVTEQALEHPGVKLLWQCSEAVSSDAAARETARAQLNRMLTSISGWQEAWARYALGLSLLRESGEGRHQAALVNLAHLPARFSRDLPYLTGLALADMIRALTAAGDTRAADALRGELRSEHPNHPVLSTLASQSSTGEAPGKPSPRDL